MLKENFGINKSGVDEQRQISLKVAKDEGCEGIDLYRAVATADPFDPDGIHPNAAGARKIAETVFASLSPKK